MAVGATLFGCALAWIGLVVPALRALFDYAWFVGGLASGVAYVLGMRAAGDRAHVAVVPSGP